MALQINTTTRQGLTVSDAYLKIETFEGNKEQVKFTIKVFLNSEARNTKKDHLDEKWHVVDTPTTDLMPALYAHLKTLPEFAGAVDV